MNRKIRIIIALAAVALKSLQIGGAVFIGNQSYIKVFAPLAAAERGYTGAYGGEIIAAVLTALAVYYIIGRIIYLGLECLAEYTAMRRFEALKKLEIIKKEDALKK